MASETEANYPKFNITVYETQHLQLPNIRAYCTKLIYIKSTAIRKVNNLSTNHLKKMIINLLWYSLFCIIKADSESMSILKANSQSNYFTMSVAHTRLNKEIEWGRITAQIEGERSRTGHVAGRETTDAPTKTKAHQR